MLCFFVQIHATPDSTLVKVGNYTLAETPPTGYNKYLYKGNIVLKPGFISVAGKEQKFGPNVEITDEVNSGFTIGYNYDNLGNVLEQTVVDESSSNTVLSYTYEYDNTSRLSKVYTKSKSETGYNEEASYIYNNDDNIGSALFSGGEQVSYTYDAKVGWLTAISAMNGSTSRFSQSLAYLDNGNVSSQTIYNSLLTTPTSVTSYTYDDQNRLTASTRSGNSESYTYNKDGAFETKGNLTYNYVSGSHKLTSVNNSSMQYDGKGNITSDGTSGVALQDYTYFNLPLQITKNSVVTNYVYNNAGSRIYKENVGTDEYYLYDYMGKVLLIKNKKTPTKSIANVYGNGLIGKIENVFGTTPERYYYIKDHLGSIRMVIQKYPTSNEAVLAYDYFPYGEIRDSNNVVGMQNERYNFTEKERDAESEYDYFGARYYNSKLGIWLQVDPLAEKYPGWSPFNYVVANPLRLFDPDGNGPKDLIKIGMPMTVPSSWKELKTRTTVFLSAIATAAAIYYTPQAVTAISGWWMNNPARANDLATGLIDLVTPGPSNTNTKLSSSQIDDMLGAASTTLKGGSSPVGRALQSHSSRIGSWLEGLANRGNNELNTSAGEKILEEILKTRVVTKGTHKVFGEVIKIRRDDGSGAWYKVTGEFIGFLEKYTEK